MVGARLGHGWGKTQIMWGKVADHSYWNLKSSFIFSVPWPMRWKSEITKYQNIWLYSSINLWSISCPPICNHFNFHRQAPNYILHNNFSELLISNGASRNYKHQSMPRINTPFRNRIPHKLNSIALIKIGTNGEHIDISIAVTRRL